MAFSVIQLRNGSFARFVSRCIDVAIRFAEYQPCVWIVLRAAWFQWLSGHCTGKNDNRCLCGQGNLSDTVHYTQPVGQISVHVRSRWLKLFIAYTVIDVIVHWATICGDRTLRTVQNKQNARRCRWSSNAALYARGTVNKGKQKCRYIWDVSEEVIGK